MWCGGEKEELEKEISVKQSVLWKMQAHTKYEKEKNHHRHNARALVVAINKDYVQRKELVI